MSLRYRPSGRNRSRSSASRWTSQSVFNFQSQFSTRYNLLFADILLIAVPPLLLFLFLNRRIVGGMTAGAVKGLHAPAAEATSPRAAQLGSGARRHALLAVSNMATLGHQVYRRMSALARFISHNRAASQARQACRGTVLSWAAGVVCG